VYEEQDGVFRVAVFVDSDKHLPLSGGVAEQFHDAHAIPGSQGVSVFSVGGAACLQTVAGRNVTPDHTADSQPAAVSG
jgi:hypothetical protein